jgi:hypothetical protein
MPAAMAMTKATTREESVARLARRARTQADEAPADAEQHGAGEQRPVDVAFARPGGRAIAALTADP